jgi:Tfp pilus assembly protein PilX
VKPSSQTVLRSVSKNTGGMVLLLCLIFLMALTLLGLSASSDAILQNKLTSNLKENERAKQSAQLGLLWAERWLLDLDSPVPVSCAETCDGLYLHAAGALPPKPQHEDFSWWMAHGHEAGIDPLTGVRLTTIASDSIKPPVWIIEILQSIPPNAETNPDLQVWYRILARGNGRTDNAVSVVESIVVRSWPLVEDAEISGSGITGSCPGSGMSAVCGRFSWRELR